MGGTTDPMAAAFTTRRGHADGVKQSAQEHPELVERARDVGHDPPVAGQRLAIEQPDGRLGVAHVEHDQHNASLM